MVHSEGSKQCQATGGAIVRFLWSGLDRSYVCSTCVLCVCPGPSCAFLPVESQDSRVGNGFVCWARKQLGTRVIEGVSKVEGVTGCVGWSFRTIARCAECGFACGVIMPSSIMPCGGVARWAMPPMGRGNLATMP